MAFKFGPRNQKFSNTPVVLGGRGPTIIVQEGVELPAALLADDKQSISGADLRPGSTVRILRRRPPSASFIFLGSTIVTVDGTWTYGFATGAAVDGDQIQYEGSQTSPALTISTGAISITATVPAGVTGSPFSLVPEVHGGVAPYTFTLVGTPPGGVSGFDTTTGALTGNPNTVGTFSGLTIRVRDNVGATADFVFSITVSAPSSVPPANVSAPTISLTRTPPVEGDEITGDVGAWSGSPTGYARQFYANDVAISGATGSTLILGADQVGKTIKFGVIASNAAGASGEIKSTATAAVVAAQRDVPLAISLEVPPAYVGEAFLLTPNVTGGDGSTKVFSLTGSVPPWTSFAFSTSTGQVSGIPVNEGNVSGLSITVKDAGNPTGVTRPLGTIVVNPARPFQNRVRQRPADQNLSLTAELGKNYFRTASNVTLSGTASPARAPADPSVPVAPKKYSAGWVAGIRETPIATYVLSRASGSRLSWTLAAGLLPTLVFKGTNGTTEIARLVAKPYSYSPVGGVRVRRWGALSLGGDPNQFLGVFFDTTDDAANDPRGKIYRQNNLNNGGAIEEVTDTSSSTVFKLVPNGTYDTGFFGERSVFGVVDNALRDVEHAVWWEHFGAAVDWAAQAAVADDPEGAPGNNKYYQKTYTQILKSAALRGPNGEGVLKALGVWASDTVFEGGVPTKWAKPHTFLDGADGVAAWLNPAGYNRGSGPKLIFTNGSIAGETSVIGTNLEEVRLARLSDVTAGANYQSRDAVDQARTDAAKGKVRDSLRIEGGSGSDYTALPTDPTAKAAARQTRIKEQVFNQFLVNHGFSSVPAMEIREERWKRGNPALLTRPAWITPTSWQAGVDSKGFPNEDPLNPGMPERYGPQKYDQHSRSREWATIGSDGTRTPTSNGEKQYFAEHGDTTRTINDVEQVVPYDPSWNVFDFGQSDEGQFYLDIKTKPIGDTTLGPVLNDDTRFAVGGILTSWPGRLQIQYGVTWIQFRRYRPANFPLRTAAGDFFSSWIMGEDGKIAVNWHGVYREDDLGENVPRTAGTCPITFHTSLGGTNALNPCTPYFKERVADFFYDHYFDDSFLEMAIVVEPEWVSGVGFPVPSIYIRRANQKNFRLVTGNSKVGTDTAFPGRTLVAGLPGASNPYKPDTPYMRNGLNGYTHGQNPRATLKAQAQVGHWRLNNAWDPQGFFANWDDGGALYPMVTRIGAVGYAIPEAWANGAPVATRTFDYRNSKKQHKRGIEIGLKPASAVHGAAYAVNTAHSAVVTYGSTLSRPITDISVMTDGSGEVILPGSTDGWGWGGEPADAGKTFSLTVTRTTGHVNSASSPTTVTGVVGERWAGDGLATPVIPAETWPIFGTGGDDILLGSEYPCVIIAGDGDDIIYPGPTRGSTAAVDMGGNGDARRRQQNRTFAGTGKNTVYVTAGAFDWIKPGRRGRSITRTKIVIPTGHTGSTRIAGFKPVIYDENDVAQTGDILDLTGYAFADLAAVRAAIVEEADNNTPEQAILQLPGAGMGKILFEATDFLSFKKADLTAANVILSGGGYVAPSVPLAAAGNYTAGSDCKITTVGTPVAVAKAALVALSQPDDAVLRTFSAVSNAVNGSVAVSGANVIFTPTPGFVGLGSFDFSVTQGAATHKGTVVVRAERILLAATVAVAVSTNTPKNLDLKSGATGFPDFADLYVSSVGNPTSGKLSLVAGSLVYTPNTGFTGADTFTYVISDGFHVLSGTVNLTVSGTSANTAPVAGDASLSTTYETAKAINLLALSSDANGDTLAITAVSTPAHGTVTLSGGVATYTPAGGYSGPDAFTYTVSDGAATDDGLISITVAASGAGDAPVDLNFKTANYAPSAPTVVRSGTAYTQNSSGDFVSAAANTLRRYFIGGVAQGALIEKAGKNWVRNSTFAGAGPGVNGTNHGGSATAGLTHSVVGTVVENGFTCIDITVSGTATAGATGFLYFDTNVGIPAALSDLIAFSAYVRIVGGSTAGITAWRLSGTEYAGTTAGTSGTTAFTMPTAGAIKDCRVATSRTLTGTGTTSIRPFLAYVPTSGVAINFTIRIAVPMVEKYTGAALPVGGASSPILTSGTALDRAADAVSTTLPAGATSVTFTFDDGSTQAINGLSAGPYTIPTNLNRPIVARMVSA